MAVIGVDPLQVKGQQAIEEPAAPGPQLPLPLYAAPAAAALYSPRLTRAQQQLLLCSASHAHHFVRVMMARDVRYNRDPRKLLLLCLYFVL